MSYKWSGNVKMEIKTTVHRENTLVGRSNKRQQASPKKGKGNVQEKEQNELIDRENAKQNSNENDEDYEFMVVGNVAQENDKKEQIGENDEAWDEAYEFMVNGVLPGNYWQKLAEKIQIAIVETQKENKELGEVVNNLKTDLEKMASGTKLLEECVKVKKFGWNIKTTAHGEITLVERSNKGQHASPRKGEGNVQEKELIDHENAKQNSNENDEDYEFMVNEIIPDEDWEILAENRQIALIKFLDENEQMCSLVNTLRSDLKKMAARAELLEQWFIELFAYDTEHDDTEEKDES